MYVFLACDNISSVNDWYRYREQKANFSARKYSSAFFVFQQEKVYESPIMLLGIYVKFLETRGI